MGCSRPPPRCSAGLLLVASLVDSSACRTCRRGLSQRSSADRAAWTEAQRTTTTTTCAMMYLLRLHSCSRAFSAREQRGSMPLVGADAYRDARLAVAFQPVPPGISNGLVLDASAVLLSPLRRAALMMLQGTCRTRTFSIATTTAVSLLA